MGTFSPSRSLRLVLFDFDGTLVDSVEAIVHAMRAAFGALGLAAPEPDAVRLVVGLPLAQAVKRLLPAEVDADTLGALLEAYRVEHLAYRSREGYEEPLYEGIRDVLDGLFERRVPCGVATGKSRRGLLQSLERHGLERYFVVLKTADDGPGKPDPFMLFAACQEVGCRSAEAAMVGDTVFDVTMAVDAGAVPIGVSWGYHPRQALAQAGAAYLVDSAPELGALLGRLT